MASEESTAGDGSFFGFVAPALRVSVFVDRSSSVAVGGSLRTCGDAEISRFQDRR